MSAGQNHGGRHGQEPPLEPAPRSEHWMTETSVNRSVGISPTRKSWSLGGAWLTSGRCTASPDLTPTGQSVTARIESIQYMHCFKLAASGQPGASGSRCTRNWPSLRAHWQAGLLRLGLRLQSWPLSCHRALSPRLSRRRVAILAGASRGGCTFTINSDSKPRKLHASDRRLRAVASFAAVTRCSPGGSASASRSRPHLVLRSSN
eukprot:3025560-Rhodomonas_salina.1